MWLRVKVLTEHNSSRSPRHFVGLQSRILRVLEAKMAESHDQDSRSPKGRRFEHPPEAEEIMKVQQCETRFGIDGRLRIEEEKKQPLGPSATDPGRVPRSVAFGGGTSADGSVRVCCGERLRLRNSVVNRRECPEGEFSLLTLLSVLLGRP